VDTAPTLVCQSPVLLEVAPSRNTLTTPRPPPLHIAAAIAHRCCCCSPSLPILEDRSLPLARPATLFHPPDSAWRNQACRASERDDKQYSPAQPTTTASCNTALTPIARHSLACNTRSIDPDSPLHRHARRSCSARRRPETNDRQEQARAPQGHSLYPQRGIGCPCTRHIVHHT
jgi:hypothetical protein